MQLVNATTQQPVSLDETVTTVWGTTATLIFAHLPSPYTPEGLVLLREVRRKRESFRLYSPSVINCTFTTR